MSENITLVRALILTNNLICFLVFSSSVEAKDYFICLTCVLVIQTNDGKYKKRVILINFPGVQNISS